MRWQLTEREAECADAIVDLASGAGVIYDFNDPDLINWTADEKFAAVLALTACDILDPYDALDVDGGALLEWEMTTECPDVLGEWRAKRWSNP